MRVGVSMVHRSRKLKKGSENSSYKIYLYVKRIIKRGSNVEQNIKNFCFPVKAKVKLFFILNILLFIIYINDMSKVSNIFGLMDHVKRVLTRKSVATEVISIIKSFI